MSLLVKGVNKEEVRDAVLSDATRFAGANIDAKISENSVFSVVPTAVPESGITPLHVTFGASIVGGQSPFSYAWDFGDGATSTLKKPTHTYGTGTFTVSLTVTDAQGKTAGGELTVTAQEGVAIVTAGITAVEAPAMSEPVAIGVTAGLLESPILTEPLAIGVTEALVDSPARTEPLAIGEVAALLDSPATNESVIITNS